MSSKVIQVNGINVGVGFVAHLTDEDKPTMFRLSRILNLPVHSVSSLAPLYVRLFTMCCNVVNSSKCGSPIYEYEAAMFPY